ncbi:hypothetical protein CI610_02488 [invertebrate metagenome]|uniref:Uncharacterized protein n=1 Tax=invertebrate metagenome TaxID=1711999 RepID=A0A2H9T5S7_9ZZZZ
MIKTTNRGLKANRFLMTLTVVAALSGTPALAEQGKTTREMDHSGHPMNHKEMNHQGMDHSNHKKR